MLIGVVIVWDSCAHLDVVLYVILGIFNMYIYIYIYYNYYSVVLVSVVVVRCSYSVG